MPKKKVMSEKKEMKKAKRGRNKSEKREKEEKHKEGTRPVKKGEHVDKLKADHLMMMRRKKAEGVKAKKYI